MSEKSSNEKDSSRHFNWGPPSNKVSESLKEWLVYVFLLIILGIGIWGLLDLNVNKSETDNIVKQHGTTIPTNKNENENEKKIAIKEEVGVYQVQLGAFSNEQTAREAYKGLVAKGFFPAFSAPDNEYEIYRVSLGPYKTEREANKISENLNSLDFSCFVVESP